MGMGTQNQWHESPYTLGKSFKSFKQVLIRFWSHFPKSIKEIMKLAINQRAKFWKSDYSHLGWPIKGSGS